MGDQKPLGPEDFAYIRFVGGPFDGQTKPIQKPIEGKRLDIAFSAGRVDKDFKPIYANWTYEIGLNAFMAENCNSRHIERC